jgi:hypothetical protein
MVTTDARVERTICLFLTRGAVAIAWAAVFAVAADSLTVGAGVLLIAYPLIDLVDGTKFVIQARLLARRRRRLAEPAGPSLSTT